MSNLISNITLDNLRWINSIESAQKGDKNQLPFLTKWRIFSRMQMLDNYLELLKFTGGEKPNELLFELNMICVRRNSDEIMKHKLENSAGALTCLGNKYSKDFIISGIVVFSDELFDELILSIRIPSPVSSQLILSLEGLKLSKGKNAVPVWDNVKNIRLKVTDVQVIFHYGHAN